MSPAEIASFIVAFILAAVSVANMFVGRGKAKVDITKTLTEAATSLIQPLENRITVQEQEIAQLKIKIATLDKTIVWYAARVEYLMDGIKQLLEQIKGLNATPCWSPKEWKRDD
jgi:uncharacterized protein YoxC